MNTTHLARIVRRAPLVAMALAVALAASGCDALVAPREWGKMGRAQDPAPDPASAEQALPTFVHIAACYVTEEYVRALAEAQRRTNAQVVFDITIAGPEVGASMVATGEAQLAILTRRHGEAFRDEGREGYVPLEVTPIAETGLAIVVHAGQDLPSLTQAQLVSLFTGYVLDWNALGAGSGVPEIVVQDRSSTSRRIFDESLLGGRAVSSAAVVVPDDRAAAQYVAEHPGAVSYVAAAVIDERLHAIPVEMGLTSRIGSGRTLYPASQEIVVVSPLTMTLEILDLKTYAAGPRGADLRAEFFGSP